MKVPRRKRDARDASSLAVEIRGLIGSYGKEAVRDAALAATKKPRGRQKENDWFLLHAALTADARDFLEGRDPFYLRSKYAVAKRFAEEHPGHNVAATMRRVQRKLAEGRRFQILFRAWLDSYWSYPVAAHIKALEALLEQQEYDSPQAAAQLWRPRVEEVNRFIDAYRERFGEPDTAMTMRDLETKLFDGRVPRFMTKTR